ADTLCAKLALGPSSKALDIGTGTGGNAAIAAARLGSRVTAVDISPRLLEAGRKRALVEGLDIEFVEADALDLPFSEASFDAVSSIFGVMAAGLWSTP
ncbi:MAG: class I SAM-dependent methyltransferase, partial [Chromatiales bacterium]